MLIAIYFHRIQFRIIRNYNIFTEHFYEMSFPEARRSTVAAIRARPPAPVTAREKKVPTMPLLLYDMCGLDTFVFVIGVTYAPLAPVTTFICGIYFGPPAASCPGARRGSRAALHCASVRQGSRVSFTRSPLWTTALRPGTWPH